MIDPAKTDAHLERIIFISLLLALIITFIPWLGMTWFNTKGEPREAIVAMSMMESGNYILPVSMGSDIPYKPPFLAWLIVGASYLTGGLNEFASRLPSAVAGIAMIMAIAVYFTRRRGWTQGILTALVTATSIEVWRAVTACRVDMVLTACMVGAMMVMESGYRRRSQIVISPWAILLMTGAALTKGPVGVALPCLVMLVYVAARGGSALNALWRLAVIGGLSLVIPAAWYVAAYNAGGGETFVNLALEENIGRLTGRMSYESHVNPFYYNFLTLASGMLPYTLLALLALFTIKRPGRLQLSLRHWRRWLETIDATSAFALVVTVVIFVFYCIPASKRSVYLLPIYPFVAYFVALGLIRAGEAHRWIVNTYGIVIAVVAWLLSIVLFLVSEDIIEPTLFGKKAASIIGLFNNTGGSLNKMLIVLPVATSVEIFRSLRKSGWTTTIFSTMVTTLTIYWCLSGFVLPTVLNAKSDRPVAAIVEKELGKGESVYQYIGDPMLRFYTIGFYLGDRVRLYDGPAEGASASIATTTTTPPEGLILVGKKDLQPFIQAHPDVALTEIYRHHQRSCDSRDTVMLLRFTPRPGAARFGK